MRRPRTARIVAGALVAMVVGFLCVPVAVEAYSRSRLRDRLQDVRQEAAAARRELAQKRQQAVRARNRLVEAQQELAAAEARLARARRQLRRTQRELEEVREELERTRRRLAQHSEAMEQRLLAAFRAHEPTYAEVLLGATSFEDFATRAEFTQRIARRDESVLIRIVDDKMTMEAQQRMLEQKEAEQKRLKAKVARERELVDQKREEAAALARKAQEDVAEAMRQLEAMEAEARAISAMLRRLYTSSRSGGGGGGVRYYGSWSGSFARPVPGSVTSGFGWRIHPITGTRRFHDGIDLACSGGTPIACAADGVVISTGWRGPYGLTVIVDHGSGVSTMYAHCERGSIQVSPGQRVSRGQTLARVDSTGWSTGDHLHWSVYKNGSPVDPFAM